MFGRDARFVCWALFLQRDVYKFGVSREADLHPFPPGPLQRESLNSNRTQSARGKLQRREVAVMCRSLHVPGSREGSSLRYLTDIEPGKVFFVEKFAPPPSLISFRSGYLVAVLHFFFFFCFGSDRGKRWAVLSTS